MIQKSYHARVNRLRSMITGLAAHQKQLKKYGATPEFRASLVLVNRDLSQIQKHRQILKEKSILTTAAKNRYLKEAERLCRKARKWVRRELPPENWSEFGFQKGDWSKSKSNEKKVKGNR